MDELSMVGVEVEVFDQGRGELQPFAKIAGQESFLLIEPRVGGGMFSVRVTSSMIAGDVGEVLKALEAFSDMVRDAIEEELGE